MTTSPPSAAGPPALPPCWCGGTEYRQLYGPRRFQHDGAAFEIRACVRCALARTAPPPFDDDRTADVHQELPYEPVAADDAKWRAFFAPLLDAAQRHTARGRFLDVGCGPGLAVQMAAERGYEAYGVEINSRSAAYARDVLGLRVADSDLASAGFPDGHFSVVMLSHVLEHLMSPSDVLAEVRRVLAPDGVLVVEVPNMAGLPVRALGARWPGWAPYMHVWQFTPKTLVASLARAGFAAVEVRARENMEFGRPRGALKRIARATAFRALERAAVVLNRADKVLCVARPLAPGRS